MKTYKSIIIFAVLISALFSCTPPGVDEQIPYVTGTINLSGGALGDGEKLYLKVASDAGFVNIKKVVLIRNEQYDFVVNLSKGSWFFKAFVDKNNDGADNSGEKYGNYGGDPPVALEITQNFQISEIEITVDMR